VLLAVVLRVVFAALFLPHPLAGIVPEDTEAYRTLATAIAHGDLGHPAFTSLSPLYAFVLAPFAALTSPAQHVAVTAVQIAMDGVSVALLYWIGRRIFSPAIGMLASAFYALYGISIYYSAVVLPVTTMVLLVLLTVAAVLHTPARRWHAAAPGVALGLLALARPNAIVLLLPMLLWIRTGSPDTAVSRRGRAGGLVLGLVLALAPFSLRSWWSGNGASPFPANGGINFYIGNNPDANGMYVAIGGVSDLPLQQVTTSIAEASRRSGRSLDARGASRFWMAQGFDFIRRTPGEAGIRTLEKAALFFRAEEIPLNINYAFARRQLPILRLTPNFGVFMPLAFTGVVALLGTRADRKRADVRLLLAILGTYAASVVVFFMSDRYRMPAVPLLLVLAAYGAATLAESRRERRRWLVAWLTLVVSAWLVNYPFAHFTYPEYAKDYYSLGQVQRQRGKLEAAADLYRKALELTPEAKEVWVELAATRYFSGHVFEAETALRRALELDAGFEAARRNLAILYKEQGLFEDARSWAVDDAQRAGIDQAQEEVRRHTPDRAAFAQSQYDAGVRAYGEGRLGEARYAFKRALAARPEMDEAAFALAMVAKDLHLKMEFCAAAARAASLKPDDAEYRRERNLCP
jgi:4-amino-4-deoxy-L-arabinose transferase-like glycosyltransferase/Tfp pilus assembly protein PilF